jgi:glycosyltransferase involved in cell wall biosynthesis
MLVDNGVHGDSRVQKSARSMADAGWHVTLLGIKGANATEAEWKLGEATVRLVPVPLTLSTPYNQIRRSWLRRPFAYPPGRLAGYRVQLGKGRQADIRAARARIAARRRAGHGRATDVLTMAVLKLRGATSRVSRLWIRFRAGQTTRVRTAQQDPASMVNRAGIAFWRRLRGPRSWRRLDPGLWDYELAVGPVIDRLRPDIIHANDFRMLGVGIRAAQRARAAGRPVRLVWDAHESVSGVMPRASNPRWLPAQIEYVREFAPQADAVVTVSPTLAQMLQTEHNLPQRPAVVLNAPPSAPHADEAAVPVPDLRGLCGIAADVPLLVYCGGVNPRRGLDTMIDALPDLPEVHVALVTLHPSGNNSASQELLGRAGGIGVADRVHLLPYVGHWQVAEFLSAASAGVIPIHHQHNHEIALITKFFEYSHARLPIVVSDVQTMADTVRATGQGEVFIAKDLASYLAAVRAVLADPQKYRAAYEKPDLLPGWTWEAQAEILDAVYRRVLA